MAKDPSTTRIPRLDGMSRIPTPGSFGTSHIRPPSATAGNVLKSTTQIFRTPALPTSTGIANCHTTTNNNNNNTKTRPISSYHPAVTPLHDLEVNLKKSVSGDRLNNAVNMISKRTSNVFKKYFGQSKLMAGASASPGSGSSRGATQHMTSSLPHTPLPASKQATLLTSSTPMPLPMPLMRSETFVCDEEKGQEREQEEELEEQQRPTLESTRISNVGFCGDVTLLKRTVILSSEADNDANYINCTRPVISSQVGEEQQEEEAEEEMQQQQKKQRLELEQVQDATCILSPVHDDRTHVLATFPSPSSTTFAVDRTRSVIPTQMLDLTKSMDQLPLLEHMSMPSDLDVLGTGREEEKEGQQEEEQEHSPHADDELNVTVLDALDVTLTALAPDKTNMKLPLNSTVNMERLVDLSDMQSPARHIQLLNLTREFLEQTQTQTPQRLSAGIGRRSMAQQQSLICLTPQSGAAPRFHHQTPVQVHLLSPLLKAARSDLVLPTRTPDGDGGGVMPPLDATLIAAAAAAAGGGGGGGVGSQMLPLGARARYSFGLDLTESTLDSSIDLVDNSFSTPQQLLKKQHSFDLDESLGILTPDQMKEFLDSSSQHNNGNLSHHLELQLAAVHHQQQQQQQQQQQHHHVQQQQLLHLQQQQQLQLRMEQTPSPEELPLDPIEPQLVAAIVAQPAVVAAVATAAAAAVPTTTATVASKQLSNSFITSVTSVTSLDTGYQGDGEMSRPASRGACDHSPSNGPHLGRVSRQPSFPPMPQAAAAAAAEVAPMRRQDPMTDSDFFTESDADDVLQRGDRRAQVIDGQLYGQAMQPSASVPQLEDSCMESSGIFTDVENRCDEEMRLPELEVDMEVDHEMQEEEEEEEEVDMSPDDSTTQTMRKAQGQQQREQQQREQSSLLREREREQQPRPLSSSSAATTTLSLSNRTSYCSVDGGSAKSFCDEAFSVGSDSQQHQQQQQQQRSSQLSVQRAASPRPHVSSLTSLCTVENLSTSNSTPAASPKLSKTATNKALKTTTTTTTTTRTITTTRTSPVSRKTHTPNKWDAVMHKIASNKSTIKTNYSDVKSKVSTLRPQVATAATAGVGGGVGVGGGSTPPTTNVLGRSQSSSPSSSSGSPRISPPIRRSPSATAPLKQQRSTLKPLSVTPTSTSTRQPQDKGSVGVVVGGSVFARLAAKSPTSPTAASAAKQRLQSTQVNRGRSYSKDSQKSSHSDLSTLCNGNASGGGSPKLLAKTPLRAAKKRDVRNLSISPTDLGPPPKTQQTAKGQSTRNKSNSPTSTATQKRLASSNSITIAAISPANSNKVCAKTTAIQQKNLQVLQNKTDGKNNSTTIKNGTTKHLSVNIAEESLRSGVDQTELQELNELGLLLSAVPNAVPPRDSKRASISHEHIDCTCGTTETADCQCDAAAEKAPKVKRQERKEPLELESQESNKERLEQELIQQNEMENVQPKETEITASKVLYDNTTKTLVADGGIGAAQMPALKCYIQKGSLNYELLASCLELRKQQQDESQCQLTGLAIVVQFMSKQMDKLSCQESKVSSKLEETLTLLQQTQRNCEELRKQLHDKDVEWTRREQENKHLQRSELQQAQDKLQEVQMLAKERFRELESQLQAKDEEKKQALQSYHQEIEHQLRHKQEQLQLAEQQVLQLQKRIHDQEQQEQQLREKLTRKESSYTMRLSSATQREEEAQATIRALTKELQTLRASTEHKERDLRDRLALSQDEVTVLRTSSQRRSPSTSLNDSAAELCRLTSEADSLRCVLELKQAEISTLSKQNAEQQREIDELRSRSNRVSVLEATNEMLRTELETKTEKEKELQRQNDEMQKAFNHESIKRKRISCDNEQLQYNLKQRTEQLLLVQNQLQEQLSNCSQLDASLNYSRNSSMRASLDCAAARCNASSSSTSSPPASPVIKGVIERNDSVSWVLEMDDETPQVAASKLVRRAGSLRSTCERSPTQRRQLSQSASVASGSSTINGHANGHAHHSPGPNPLSQSMSATILMRTQSHEPESPRPLCRARSQSICGNQKTTTTVEQSLPDWHPEELRASSPQPLPPPPVDMRARCSTMNKAMNKKFQEIQESAGEAMVSGANSEDESCSASSEDMRSSSASSTASAAGLSLSKRQKQPSRMSIEEALLLEQVNSLNGTPMEVSWSEDAADADAAEAHVLA